ncbi:putative WRKY transcription factor 71 [Iris pallida]|uniref:WRKY transcription factor 71 n=1 Tax=Iris pallida TaxID=29817 RepID=A0AAX6DXK6_IRIPA|nr:putative WRKY transcription factor 71 [Iris pallida]
MSGDHFGRVGGGCVDGFPFVNDYSTLLSHSDQHGDFHGIDESFFGFSDYLLGSADAYGQLIDASVDADAFRAPASGGGGDKMIGGTTVLPVTPNSSASWSSTEAAGEEKEEEEAVVVAKEDLEDGSADKSKKVNKPRKKGEKRKREARFAFMTKSEVDHLEDGYRWRKYGQKAVKHSPYPRSYYRCTTQKCSVKKRVERSFEDPTIVITTYEGQHTHQSPATVRGAGSHILAPPPALPSGFHQELLMHQLPHVLNNQQQQQMMREFVNPNMYLPSPLPQQQQQLQFPDYGLLQDIVPPFSTN